MYADIVNDISSKKWTKSLSREMCACVSVTVDRHHTMMCSTAKELFRHFIHQANLPSPDPNNVSFMEFHLVDVPISGKSNNSKKSNNVNETPRKKKQKNHFVEYVCIVCDVVELSFCNGFQFYIPCSYKINIFNAFFSLSLFLALCVCVCLCPRIARTLQTLWNAITDSLVENNKYNFRWKQINCLQHRVELVVSRQST